MSKVRVDYIATRADTNELSVSGILNNIGSYAAGLVLESVNQIFVKDGAFYRAASTLTLPYTTTGNWAVESVLFVGTAEAQSNSTAVDIASLRSDFNNLLDKLRSAGIMSM